MGNLLEGDPVSWFLPLASFKNPFVNGTTLLRTIVSLSFIISPPLSLTLFQILLVSFHKILKLCYQSAIRYSSPPFLFFTEQRLPRNQVFLIFPHSQFRYIRCILTSLFPFISWKVSQPLPPNHVQSFSKCNPEHHDLNMHPISYISLGEFSKLQTLTWPSISLTY